MPKPSQAKAKGLLSLALHENTPEHERNTAALAFCKVVSKSGLLDDEPAPASPAPVYQSPPAAPWRPPPTSHRGKVTLPSGRVVSQEQWLRVLRKMWQQRQ